MSGRQQIAHYWRARMERAGDTGFLIEKVDYDGEHGAVLDYLGFGGERVRIIFVFNQGGKITETTCGQPVKNRRVPPIAAGPF